ncbi:MAG: glycoside hydrolase [Candidatus Nitrosocosmicus sp.]|nr:glycoside hydrolase [Candidatus Nitrosocosmicus sp.]
MHKLIFFLGITGSIAIAMTAMIAISMEVNALEESKIETINSYTAKNVSNMNVAVEPHNGTIYAAFYRSNNDVSNAYLTYSNDGGKTFLEPVRVNEENSDAGDAWYPISLDFSPKGDVYVVWAFHNENVTHPWGDGVRDFKISKSTDGGKSFGESEYPGSTPAADGLGFTRTFHELAVSENGTVFIPHLSLMINATQSVAEYVGDDISGEGQTNVFRSTDGGNTFDEFVLDKLVCNCCHTKAVTSPQGDVYFSWRSLERASAQNSSSTYNFENASAYETARDIVVSRTVDGGLGNGYSEPHAVTENKWFINGCPSSGAGIDVDDRGRVHTAYFTGSDQAPDGIGYYYAYSDDNGTSFKNLPLLTSDFVPLVHQGTNLSVDGAGNTWITFITPKMSNSTQEMEYHQENEATIHLFVVDENANILTKKEFTTSTIGQPVISSSGGTTVLAFENGDDYRIYRLSLSPMEA